MSYIHISVRVTRRHRLRKSPLYKPYNKHNAYIYNSRRRCGIITSTNPVSCSFTYYTAVYIYIYIFLHDAYAFSARFYHYNFFSFYIELIYVPLQCHSITNGSRPPPRLRRETGEGKRELLLLLLPQQFEIIFRHRKPSIFTPIIIYASCA